jgi:hypothetical protein
MKIRAWGPALALLSLIVIAILGLHVQQPKPNNHAQPPKAEQQLHVADHPAEKHLAGKDDSEGGDESHWYDIFVEHLPDWFVALFTALLTYVTYRLVKSTNRLWESSENAFRQKERAFVFLEGFNYELTTLLDGPSHMIPAIHSADPGLGITRFAVQPRWKNGGSTPTKNLTIQVGWRGPIGPIPPEHTYREAPQSFFLSPNAIEPSSYVEMPGGQALINWANNPVGDAPMMWIWGRAGYEDVFGKPHFSEWCYQVRFSRHIRSERMRAQFIQWGEYNRTDDDESR